MSDPLPPARCMDRKRKLPPRADMRLNYQAATTSCTGGSLRTSVLSLAGAFCSRLIASFQQAPARLPHHEQKQQEA